MESTKQFVKFPINLNEISHARSVQVCIDEPQKPTRPKGQKVSPKLTPPLPPWLQLVVVVGGGGVVRVTKWLGPRQGIVFHRKVW